MHKRKLQALQYPNFSGFDVHDAPQLRKMILWLEEQKIRFYPGPQRQGLRDIASREWEKSFLSYLKDLQCPREFKAGMNEQQLHIVLDWLLGTAVSSEYSDNAKVYNKVAIAAEVKLEDPAVTIHAAQQPSLLQSKATEETLKLALDLAAVFNMPPPIAVPGESIDEQVAHILRLIWRRIQKTVARKKQKNAKAQTTETKFDPVKEREHAFKVLDLYPLGFSTGNDKLDQAAKVLRLLHLQDLRELQTLINEVIVSVQEFTADPKTDSRLGKVGVS
jgi:RLL motif-containing protein 1